MSNDIQPSKLPPAPMPAAVATAQPTRAAEAAKPQPVEAPKPAPEAKADPTKKRATLERCRRKRRCNARAAAAIEDVRLDGFHEGECYERYSASVTTKAV